MHDEATTATPAPAPDFTAQVNDAFRAFVNEQAEVLIGNHGCIRGATLVAIDGNGYVSIASFALSKTGTDILLADALALSRTKSPDVETYAASTPAVVPPPVPPPVPPADPADDPLRWN